jgi:hypothetical protein
MELGIAMNVVIAANGMPIPWIFWRLSIPYEVL